MVFEFGRVRVEVRRAWSPPIEERRGHLDAMRHLRNGAPVAIDVCLARVLLSSLVASMSMNFCGLPSGVSEPCTLLAQIASPNSNIIITLHFSPLTTMETRNILSLEERLGSALPINTLFTFYHVSTPPTKCPAIFSAPPGAKPEPTYCESHFLNLSIRPSDKKDAPQIFALAIEVLIYSTKHLTTLFVSKADSTGYLSLLTIPKGQSSPLRTITSTFVSYLVDNRQRQNVKLVVSLFARASDQYLFPGSVENAAKHVSDDRQLVKWWCRVLDPVLRSYAPEERIDLESCLQINEETDTTAQAYLIVPGEDSIYSFLPEKVRYDPNLKKRWTHGHPLREITSFPSAPPRCLIPHFPDDPKHRLLDDLDGEIPDSQINGSATDSPSKRGTGKWRSVHTVEQFWLTMEQRSECSSGRLVGFIWVVFTPPNYEAPTQSDSQNSLTLPHESSILSLPSSPTLKAVSPHKAPSQRRKPLTGVIVPRMPRIKSTPSNIASIVSNQRAESKYYTWPTTSRGDIVLDEKKYKKATELLLRLDFANRGIAEASTKTWVDELAVLGGREEDGWGQEVEGKKTVQIPEQGDNGNAVATTTMNTMQVKRKALPLDTPPTSSESTSNTENSVNTLQPRKRAKLINVHASNGVGKENETVCSMAQKSTASEPEVNILSSNLVRKKVKVQEDPAPQQ
jgi:regulator of Ty1 transposition protein 109